MKNRIWINLGFFAALGVVMTVWAFTTIIKLDFVERPYRINAEFLSSPGLVEGFDVAYLGVRIGRISGVRLAPGKIVVALSIDRGVQLPRDVTAEVRRKSAIGEPYVEVSPPKSGTGGATLAAGATIPLANTSVPLDYRKLFDGVGKLLDAVPADDARTIVGELATGLDGRTTSIREIVDNAHDLTATLAENTDVLDELSVQLTRLTGTLAGRREKLSEGVEDLAGVTQAIRESRKQLNVALDHGPSFFRQVNTLLTTARPGLSCLLTAGGIKPGKIFGGAAPDNVNRLLRNIPTAQALLADVSDRQADGLYGRTAFMFSVPGGPKAAQEYRNPLAPPTIPKLRTCPKGPASKVAVGKDEKAPDDENADDESADGATAEPGDATPAPEESQEPVPAADTDRTSESSQDTTPLIVAIFAAVVISGGVLGWIAVGRASRRREQE
ncbi:MCE family protein [Streptosporangium amethystogenes]|uniref:MCE family protein n=1 Tax=Streptosporangium amethystogenes TaxID=2002 RepID=UPI0004C6C435|nr:MCE family protein [Streptosporangium amethystogenes]